jgi:hypothetical protein
LFASLVLLMAAATKKEKKRRSLPLESSASSGHITNLKQSILDTFDIYDSIQNCCFQMSSTTPVSSRHRICQKLLTLMATPLKVLMK